MNAAQLHNAANITQVLSHRAGATASRLAVRYLDHGLDKAFLLTYGQLDRKARAIAAALQATAKKGDRILLLFPPGVEFLYAYFGCLYAGCIAVPAYPPHPARVHKSLASISRLMKDATPSVILLNDSLNAAFFSKTTLPNEHPTVQWASVETALKTPARAFATVDIAREDLAFLQYTSGSTGDPKGVMVSHRNLMDNLKHIKRIFGLSEASSSVFWLPPYHDMGLIGGILQAIYAGYPLTLFSHLAFLQKPVRWLEAISQYQATASGAPNFAYELCLRKITTEQRSQLDLSTWKVAFNGAERIHPQTLRQFADYFKPAGFQYRSFLPCYGLAESTLLVTGTVHDQVPVTQTFSKNELNTETETTENHKTMELTSCGPIASGQLVIIVNPELEQPCDEDKIGEIWVAGDSKAQGYWNKEALTQQTFRATLADHPGVEFLRTGDLGLISKGELFVAGRIKDLIIIGGRNHYPQDLEQTAESSHPAIGTLGCVAFSVSIDQKEHPVIVAELHQKLQAEADEVKEAIATAISRHHELALHDIHLVKPGTLKRTTSGKLKRQECKRNYETNRTQEKIVI